MNNQLVKVKNTSERVTLRLMLGLQGIRAKWLTGVGQGSVDLTSRRGIEGAVWNVLTLLAVGGIAITLLFVLGPTIMARAQTAAQRLSQNPGW